MMRWLTGGAVVGMVLFAAGMAMAIEPAPTKNVPLTVAPYYYDVDGSGAVEITDASRWLAGFVQWFTHPAECVVRSVYPTPPANGRPGCVYLWEIPANALPSPTP